MSNGRRILFQLSGSIACFKAAAVVSQLVQQGHEVQCLLTSGARQFIGDATLEGLTRKPVLETGFEKGHALAHIDLARWADLTVLCPASAGVISRLANGAATDLISTLFLAHEDLSRYLVFPAMNPSMYAHPAVRSNLEKLRTWGVQVIEPAEGLTACGEKGAGRLLEPDAILRAIAGALAQNASDDRTVIAGLGAGATKTVATNKTEATDISSLSGRRILVTGGGTAEPIDDVRVIANRSTGATAAEIASAFAAAGAKVTYLRARSAESARGEIEDRTFETFDDLATLLKVELGQTRFDAVIHAAAVSDFSPAHRHSGKLSSDESLTLELKPNPKLISWLRSWSTNRDVKVVAFKLAPRNERENAIARIFEQAAPDFVVYNSPEAIASGRNHETELYSRSSGANHLTGEYKTKASLAQALVAVMKENT